MHAPAWAQIVYVCVRWRKIAFWRTRKNGAAAAANSLVNWFAAKLMRMDRRQNREKTCPRLVFLGKLLLLNSTRGGSKNEKWMLIPSAPYVLCNRVSMNTNLCDWVALHYCCLHEYQVCLRSIGSFYLDAMWLANWVFVLIFYWARIFIILCS
jgi:hypothetical protein